MVAMERQLRRTKTTALKNRRDALYRIIRTAPNNHAGKELRHNAELALGSIHDELMRRHVCSPFYAVKVKYHE